MKITDIRPYLLTTQWVDDPWMPQDLHATALLQIQTDANLDGLGETTLGYFTPESVPALVDFFKPVLLGQDPMDITRLARAMFDESVYWGRSGAGRSVIAGIELALWDLKGKALKVPVYQLLGGRVHDTIPVYASGGPSCWPIDENVRKVGHYMKQGYRAAKLSTNFFEMTPPSKQGARRVKEIPIPYAQKIEQLSKNFEGLRREFGPEVDLAIDGHQGEVPNPIAAIEAIEIADALAPYRLNFYEEPLAYTDLDGYCELRARSRIPVAGGECLSGLDQFHQFIANKALHVIQPDLGFVGGLHETMRIMHHAEAYNISTAIHTGASMGPSFSASWHLAVASESVTWLECLPAVDSILKDLLLDKFELKNGCVGLPGHPGLGVRITPELLEKYRFIPGSGERS